MFISRLMYRFLAIIIILFLFNPLNLRAQSDTIPVACYNFLGNLENSSVNTFNNLIFDGTSEVYEDGTSVCAVEDSIFLISASNEMQLNSINFNSFSIQVHFQFTDVSENVSTNRRRILMFGNDDDKGLYLNSSNQLTLQTGANLSDVVSGSTGIGSTGNSTDWAYVTLTRDVTDSLVTIYLNGSQEITYKDSNIDFNITGLVKLFIDNSSGSNLTENADAKIDFFRLFDVPLSSSFVNTLYNQTQLSDLSITANPTEICEGDSTVLTVTGGSGSYVWSTGDSTASITVYPLSSDSVFSVNSILEETCNSVCFNNTDTISITVKPLPITTIEIGPQRCVNQPISITYTGPSNLNDDSNVSHYWVWGDGTETLITTDSTTYDLIFSAEGIKNIGLSITENGCLKDTIVTFEVFQLPTSNFSVPTQVCQYENNTITYNGITSSDETYVWQFGEGATANQLNPPDQDYEIIWAETGTKEVKLIVTNTISGCIDSTSLNVEVLSSPLASFTVSDNILCLNDGTNNETNVLFNGISDASTVFTWEFDGGQIVNNNIPDQDFSLSWDTPGNKKIKLTVTDPNTNCSNSDSIFINVNNFADFTLSSTDLCSNEFLNISFSGLAEAGANLIWDFDTGVLSTSGSDSTITWSTAGTFDINLIVEGNCGNDTTTQTVTVRQTPTVDFSISDNPVCITTGSTTIIFTGTANNDAVFTWDFDGGVTSKDPDQEEYAVSWEESGVKTISLFVTQEGCVSETITKTITVNNDADFSLPNDGACVNDTLRITFTGQLEGSAIIDWSFGVGSDSIRVTDTEFDVWWTTPGQKTITVGVVGSSCANSTISKTINIGTPATLDFNNDTLRCLNEPAFFSYNGIDEPGKTLTWSLGDTSSVDTIGFEQYAILWETAGVKEVIVTIDSNGCEVSDTLQITIEPIPSGTITSENLACIGDRLFVEGATDISNEKYHWIFSDENDFIDVNDIDTTHVDENSLFVAWNSDGNKLIKLVIENQDSCFSDTITKFIQVIDTNIFEIESSDDDNIVCIDDAITFTFNGDSVVGNIAWEFGQLGSASQVEDTTQQAFSVSWSNITFTNDDPVYDTIKVFIHEASCVTEPFVLPVEIRDRPDPSFTLPSTVCAGTSVSIDYTGVKTNSNWVYTWDYGDGATAPSGIEGADHDVFWSTEGIKEVRITIAYNDGLGCTEEFTQSIEVQGSPQFSVPSSPNFCVGDSIELVFNGLVENYDQVEWIVTDGTTTLNVLNEDTITIAWPSIANLNITLTTTGGSCSGVSSTSQTINISDNNNTVTIDPLSTCLNEVENIDFSASVPSGVTGFTWDLAGGDTTSISDGNPYEINVAWDQAGTYSLFLYLEDDEFCNVNTITQTITVENVVPEVSIGNLQDEYCAASDILLQAIPTNGGSPSYSWFVNNTFSGTGDVFSDNTLQNGDKIYVRMTSSVTCANPGTVASSIVTLAIPGFQYEGNIIADQDTICPNFGTTILTMSGEFTVTQWQRFNTTLNDWEDLEDETENTIEVSGLQENTLYRAIGFDRNGCDGISSEKEIQVLPITPISAFANPTRLRVGFGITLNGEKGVGDYEWYLDTLASNVINIGKTFTYVPEVDGLHKFILKSTTLEGCVDTASVDVFVTPLIEVPNTFTPNNDGVNDEWVIANLGFNNEYPNAIVWVYNRWGKLVFTSVPGYFDKQWDGTFNGIGIPAGTYYYVIDLKDGYPEIKGSITIVY